MHSNPPVLLTVHIESIVCVEWAVPEQLAEAEPVLQGEGESFCRWERGRHPSDLEYPCLLARDPAKAF